MYNLLPLIIIVTSWGISVAVSSLPFLLNENSSSLSSKLLSLSAAPLIFMILFPLILGAISVPFQKGIVRCKVPREPFHLVYFCRRVYGLCWTQVFYFKPLYSVVLGIPVFRKMVFRLFGYRGNMNFTVYPDTWIRDLPMLNIGKGAYLANRATLGTNLVLRGNEIYVDHISVGENSIIGHLVIVGTGVKVGSNVEIGLRSSLGVQAIIEDGANIKPHVVISHKAVVGKNTIVGNCCLIGTGTIVGPNLNLPAGFLCPPKTELKTQEDVEHFFSSEISELRKYKSRVFEKVQNPVSNE